MSRRRLRRAGRSVHLLSLLLALSVPAAGVACHRAGEPPAADDDADAVTSLAYTSWTPVDPDARSGVVRHDRRRAEPGLNLVHLRYLNRAALTDMDGVVVHRWSAPVAPKDGWHHVEPLPDGGLLAVHKLHGLTRLDAGSQVVWRRDDLEAHHDVAPTPDGGLWVITREIRWIDRPARRGAGSRPRQLPIVDDLLLRLDAAGRSLERISLYDVLGDAVPEARWRALRDQVALWRRQGRGRDAMERWAHHGGASEPFHLNAVELVTAPVAGVARPGDLLICVRELDLVATLDPRTRRLRWSWGPGVLQRPHDPTFLAGGHLLLFDNGARRGWSQVLAVEPASGTIVWRYRGTPPESFFSAERGAAQRLAGGDTLITESDAGRVFEVTPDGEVVWELLAPVDRSTDPPRRSTVYRLRRLPYDSPFGGRIPAPSVK